MDVSTDDYYLGSAKTLQVKLINAILGDHEPEGVNATYEDPMAIHGNHKIDLPGEAPCWYYGSYGVD